MLDIIHMPASPKADVIFVHGLGGDHLTTWQHDRSKPNDSWPYWLASSLGTAAVHSLDYQANPTRWLGEGMPLQDRAVNALNELEARDIGQRPITFIGHSLGGLLIKEILQRAFRKAKGTPWRNVHDQTSLVVFLATPHIGADVASWAGRLDPVLRVSPALRGLAAHDTHLRTLDQLYRESERTWRTMAYFETRPTNISALFKPGRFQGFLSRMPTELMIVEQGDADPKVSGCTPVPMDDDHLTICKPVHADTALCINVHRAILATFEPPTTDLGDARSADAAASVATAAPAQDRPQAVSDEKVGEFVQRLSESDDRKVAYVRKLAGLLEGAPDACEALSGCLGNPYSNAEALALALVDQEIGFAVSCLEDSRQQLSLERKTRAVAKLGEVTVLVLPALFGPSVLDRFASRQPPVDAALLALPATNRTVAELIMASFDGRAMSFCDNSGNQRFPGGDLEIPVAPEGGRSYSNAFEEAFHHHLINKLTDQEQRDNYHREDLINGVVKVALNKSAERGKSYYYVFNLSEQQAAVPEFQALVQRLKGAYPSISFIRLIRDSSLLAVDTALIEDVRELLWPTSGQA